MPPESGPGLRLGIVVLAAGGGSRWTSGGGRGHKLLAQLPDGRTVLGAALDSAREAAFLVEEPCPMAVVSGAINVESSGLNLDGFDVLRNRNWESGQASSLRVALSWAAGQSLAAVVVGMGDQPWIDPLLWELVIRSQMGARNEADGNFGITVPTLKGVRAQPVGLHRSVWGLLPTEGDEGARILMRSRPELVLQIAADSLQIDQRSQIDIDRPENLQLQSRMDTSWS